MTHFQLVSLSCGVVKGQEVISKLGKKYFSFKGIPYALPPVGDLRFKPPQPILPWNGIRDALKEGNRAPHFDMVTKEFCGNEDCLYLNIYSPEIPSLDTEAEFNYKPVMFWIHGGGFAFGHADSSVYGPDLLIQEDIVLVTVNYRLGVLGFLNLELEDAAGNMGMKDQVAALKWINKEIKLFGGDSNNITLFGESAGGASVHLHLLSDMSKGLYHKAIAQSGNSLCDWAFTSNHKERAFKLGKLLGFETNDEKELLNFFRSVSPLQFAKYQDDVTTKLDHLKLGDQAFVPSLEKPFFNNEAFISEHPKIALRNGKINNVPFLTGITSDEGISIIFAIKKYQWFINEFFSSFQLLLPISDVNPANVKKIKEFYFSSYEIGDNHDEIVKFYTDIVFLVPAYYSIMLQLKKYHGRIYFYEFSYDGKFSWYKQLMSKFRNIDVPKGTCHADDLGYLFSNDILHLQNLDCNSIDMKVSQTITHIWCSFAKNGIPSLPDSSISWNPVSEENFHCLTISDKLKYGDDIKRRIEFWKNLALV